MAVNIVTSPATSVWERWWRLAELLMLALYLWLWTLPSLFLHLFTPPHHKHCGDLPRPISNKARAANTGPVGLGPLSPWVSGGAKSNDRVFDRLGAVLDLRSSEAAPGRALFEILRLMSEMPVASPKYEFAQGLAESILCQVSSPSASGACPGISQSNPSPNPHMSPAPPWWRSSVEMALLAAFERSCRLLVERMECVEEEHDLHMGDGGGGGGGLGIWWLWTISPPPVWLAIERIVRRPWKLAMRKAGKLLWMKGGGDIVVDGRHGATSVAAFLGRVLEEANALTCQYLRRELGGVSSVVPVGMNSGHGKRLGKEECCYSVSYRMERRRRQAVEVAEMMTEKAAHEVLWLAQMLQHCASCSGNARSALMHEALVTWSLAGRRLPAMCLRAPLPRVQASLIRVCGLLFKELNRGRMEEHDYERSVNNDNGTMSSKAKLLVMWLPLFCNARSAHDIPSFTANEKSEILLLLEHTIASLTFCEQEIVLLCWLQLYTRSPFDWPNLQRCFESWLGRHHMAPYSS